MKEEIKQYILESNILYPKYNRNISRPIYWDNINGEWSNFIFTTYHEYKKAYPIFFADFLRLFFFDEDIEYFYDVEDFLKRSKVVQVNPASRKFNFFYESAKKFINFEPKNFTEIFYCYRNNIKNRPTCPICGKDVEFTLYKNGYRKFCSHKCQIHNNNKIKESKLSTLTDNEIRLIVKSIPIDLRNLTTTEIANNYLNILNYSKHINDLSVPERIYIFMNKLSEVDILCPICGKRKNFKSQGIGYTKTCGRGGCIDVIRYGDSFYRENSVNIRRNKNAARLEKGFLYIITNNSKDFYKIGISQDPITRLNNLKKNISDLYIFDCYFLSSNLGKVESFLHKRFKEKQILFESRFDGYTEFFELDKDDLEFIKDYIYEIK